MPFWHFKILAPLHPPDGGENSSNENSRFKPMNREVRGGAPERRGAAHSRRFARIIAWEQSGLATVNRVVAQGRHSQILARRSRICDAEQNQTDSGSMPVDRTERTTEHTEHTEKRRLLPCIPCVPWFSRKCLAED
jgi:hypothetical protein